MGCQGPELALDAPEGARYQAERVPGILNAPFQHRPKNFPSSRVFFLCPPRWMPS